MQHTVQHQRLHHISRQFACILCTETTTKNLSLAVEPHCQHAHTGLTQHITPQHNTTQPSGNKQSR
eukprot:NODE_4511_length_316_cov_61.370787_g4429_i0.p2 GENE.NODE_4511_length_316_cov_61.370787_g4429_i0~~NODE_4511_length_316_cov_61.370787_g4429_i0.p2  ORF type:complete len:66 (-),score=13.64 NODE_4511_length_316_cov_61.370787_g4429_i0:42-239(-)